MNNRKEEPKDRLKKLTEEKNITNAKLAKICGASESAIKKYKSGDVAIPIDVATKIADSFDVTLDWLYCRSDTMNHSDAIANIILSLDQVFRFSMKKDNAGYEWPVLLVDREFYNFIADLRRLLEFKQGSDMLEEQYIQARKNLYLKYKDYFKNTLDIGGFGENTVIEIRDFEGITIVDLLGNAIESNPKD